MIDRQPILSVCNLNKQFGKTIACQNVSFTLNRGEVLGIVGESGSGKSTLLRCLAGQLAPQSGRVIFDIDGRGPTDIWAMEPAIREQVLPASLSLIHQNPRDGLRLGISVGGNIAEPLMVSGGRHYGDLRSTALHWLAKLEISPDRIDALPGTLSGGMQQRVQIARSLVTHPRLMLLDEPTGGLDVSVQARLLDLLRGLVHDLGIAAVIVTHDLAVARLLADRLMVMQNGKVIEEGLTDQVLDDAHHPYTQLLVSSVLQV